MRTTGEDDSKKPFSEPVVSKNILLTSTHKSVWSAAVRLRTSTSRPRPVLPDFSIQCADIERCEACCSPRAPHPGQHLSCRVLGVVPPTEPWSWCLRRFCCAHPVQRNWKLCQEPKTCVRVDRKMPELRRGASAHRHAQRIVVDVDHRKELVSKRHASRAPLTRSIAFGLLVPHSIDSDSVELVL